AYPIRAGAGVHARGCAESGAARAVAKVSGPVSNESEHRAQTGAHLSPGKSPPEPEGGQETAPEQKCGGQANGSGKVAALGNPAPPAGFPLSHSRNNKLSVTFPMSRQPQPGLHS